MTPLHPLAAILDAAAAGRFPPADGAVDVLPPDDDGTFAVVALTGHAYVLGDVVPEALGRRLPDEWPGGFGGALHPDVLRWLAGHDREIGTVDAVLVAAGRGDPALPSVPNGPLHEHPRVTRARRHRHDVEVFDHDDGVVVLGRGLVGRRELSVELYDLEAPAAGAGRTLIGEGLRRVAAGEWCWAQVAPGNARSLRAFLACGFVPIGSEVLIT